GGEVQADRRAPGQADLERQDRTQRSHLRGPGPRTVRRRPAGRAAHAGARDQGAGKILRGDRRPRSKDAHVQGLAGPRRGRKNDHEAVSVTDAEPGSASRPDGRAKSGINAGRDPHIAPLMRATAPTPQSLHLDARPIRPSKNRRLVTAVTYG